VTTFDAVVGRVTLERHAEARRQLALADRIIVTKLDQLDVPAGEKAVRSAREGNASAEVLRSAQGNAPPERVMAPAIDGGSAAALSQWLGEPLGGDEQHEHEHGPPGGVRTLSVRIEQPIDFPSFALWLSMLTQLRGDEVLRVKGLLRVKDEALPVVVQAVQHVVYPNYNLPSWPDEERGSRLVIVTRGMDAVALQQLRVSLMATCAGHNATAMQ
jgi:G3E family GTPase